MLHFKLILYRLQIKFEATIITDQGLLICHQWINLQF